MNLGKPICAKIQVIHEKLPMPFGLILASILMKSFRWFWHAGIIKIVNADGEVTSIQQAVYPQAHCMILKVRVTRVSPGYFHLRAMVRDKTGWHLTAGRWFVYQVP
jgi:hypothetical protein